MKLPPLLLGSTLLFWGWQTGIWSLAIPLALILEGQQIVRWRWELSATHWWRLCQLCLCLGCLALVYILSSQRSLYLLYRLLEWLPMVFYPLLAAQAYATSGFSSERLWQHIRCQNLFSAQRQPQPRYHAQSSPFAASSNKGVLDLNLPYFWLCLLSASTANTEGYTFYCGITGLIAWMLWSGRSSRSSPILWLGMILLAGGIGFIGHLGLHQLHATVEQRAISWLNPFSSQTGDPFQSHTRIGDIGLVKLSDEIVLRVAAGDQQIFPLLLRETSYNKYQASTWIALESQFTPVHANHDPPVWQLANRTENFSTLTILTKLEQGSGLLSLPNGSFQLSRLPVANLEQNQYGVVKVNGKPGAIAYQVEFDQQRSWDSPPTAADLQVPDSEQPALKQILQQLELADKPPQQVLSQLASFFQTEFKYSLNLAAVSGHATPISAFLLQQRTGHCEYFATATTLLLRAAGIPARYATGYSAHEFSNLEGQYIVRGRDAHAWAIAYLDGHWQAFDTTPAAWIDVQAEGADPWQLWSDVWSFIAFRISTGFSLGHIKGFNPAGWAIAVFSIFLLWQFKRIRSVKRAAVKAMSPAVKPQPASAGSDSEFYLIAQALAEIGCDRQADQSLQSWIKQLEAKLPASQLDNLRCILDLHYRYRFDPNGLDPSDREKLKTLSQLWLAKYDELT